MRVPAKSTRGRILSDAAASGRGRLMLEEILDFILFGLPGWLAVLLGVLDRRAQKDKRTDVEQEN